MDLRRKLVRPLFGLFYRAYVLPRIARPSRTRFLGHPMRTDPQVFHPVYFLSSRITVAALGGLALRGKRFLDMGTGSGPVAVHAASAGAQVTACDINPHAVKLAAENLRLNGLPGEVLESNVFSALGDRQFDVICFNVPFYPKEPTSPFEHAFFAGKDFETVRAFAAGCAGHLGDDGTVVVVFSEDSDHDRILSIFTGAGLVAVGEKITRKFFEQFHAVWFRRS
jgi:release factor glutamine methyltransferase